MAKFEIDLTVANVEPEGDYLATIKKVEAKQSGPNSKNPGSTYLSWQLQLVSGKYIFHITSLAAPSMVKSMMDAADVPYDNKGFDPEPCIGKQVMVKLVVKDDPQFGMQNNIAKVWKS